MSSLATVSSSTAGAGLGKELMMGVLKDILLGIWCLVYLDLQRLQTW